MIKKMSVLLTFDVDGEQLWLCRDPENIDRPVTLSLGQYGIYEGMPRILKMLKKYDIKSTFFIPGAIAERYPELVKEVDALCHEIGNHSYSHTYPDKLPSEEAERDELVRTNEILIGLTGKKPRGYRSPAWEFSKYTIDLLKELDFKYSSNMMNRDSIARLETWTKKSDLVELPIHWALDDAAFWLYSVRIVGKAMQPVESVEKFWKDEFDGIYEEFCEEEDSKRCFVLTCHPQVIGRPGRMKVLENFIKHVKQYPNVEFQTCWETVEKYKDLV